SLFARSTNRRPPATIGWARADVTTEYPNAHFSLSFGRSAAVSPPLAADWNRVFATPLPQPFQPPALDGSRIGGEEVQRFTTTGGEGGANARPARNTATAFRSSLLSALAWRIIRPSVSAL